MNETIFTNHCSFCWRKPLLISIGKIEGWRICIMLSYTSAISKKWLAIVFHDLKLGNIRSPFGHFFGHSSARYPPYPPCSAKNKSFRLQLRCI